MSRGAFRPARIALLGCGTVGREVASRVATEGRRLGIELVAVLVRDVARDRGLGPGLATDRFDDILAREPDAIVEAIGGVEAPAACVSRALAHGIPVVTANKSLIAHHGAELLGLADRAGAALAFEATVCAGVPVLAALRQLEGDRVRSIRGLVSGTCNYLLSRLESGRSYDEALGEARARGLAEPDPSADVSGRDCAEKLAVLALASGLGRLDPGAIPREGLDRIRSEDLARARRDGLALRLVSEIAVTDRGLCARVGPALLARRHPLASLHEEETGLEIVAELAGTVMLRGRGAGPRPTTSAILGDLSRVLADRRGGAGFLGGPRHAIPALQAPAPHAGRHLIRLDAPVPGPQRALQAARAHGLEPEELRLDRAAGTLLVRGSLRRVEACAAALGAPQAGLVLPLVDSAPP